MLIIDNKIIETPIIDLFNLLRQQCYIDKIDRLNSYEIKQNNIRITCPFHSNGHERTPSCDILLEDKHDTIAGTVHCFGCGYTANFLKFVADCLNRSFKQAKDWIILVSKYSLLEDTRDITDIDINKNIIQQQNVSYVKPGELEGYNYIHPYMFKRKLTDEIINKFEVGYDPKLDAITFPVYENGKCIFVCKRRVKFKRFDMPDIHPKPIYGLDYLTDNEVYVCESVINALTLWSYGKQAVALFGTGSEYQINILKNLPQRKIILALDSDNAGYNGTNKIAKALTNKLVVKLNIPNGKDINDLSKEEFENLYEEII